MSATKDYDASKSILLRAICFIYVLFFGIISLESQGLFGSGGIKPVPKEYFCKEEAIGKCLERNYSVFSVGLFLDLDADLIIDLVSLLGVVLGSLGFLFQSFQVFPVFIILWLIAYSFYNIGLPFLGQFCDIYFLEVGFLAIFIAPSFGHQGRHLKDDVLKFLVKCLYFRMLLSSGLHRLLNLNEHTSDIKESGRFTEAQYLPAPFAWYWHYTDSLASVLLFHATLLNEIVLPFVLFLSSFYLNALHFSLTLSLQIIAVFTGNYGIYPLFVSLMGLFTVVDAFEYNARDKKKSSRSLISLISLEHLIFLFVVLIMSFVVYEFFTFPNGVLGSLLKEAGITMMVTNFQKISLIFTCLMYLFTMCAIVYKVIVGNSNLSLLNGAIVILTATFGWYWLFRTMIQQGCLFSENPCVQGNYNSFVDPKVTLSPNFVPGPYGAPDGIQYMSSLSVEISNSEKGPWEKLHYKSFMHGLEKELPLNGIHVSRFEHEVWMAAHSTIESNSWLYGLVYGILQGSPSVAHLFRIEKQSKPQPPKFVRLVKTRNHFNRSCKNSVDRCEENKWVSKSGDIYLSPVHLSSPDLQKYILQLKLGPVSKKPITEPKIVEEFRGFIRVVKPDAITWGLVIHHVVIFTAIKLLQL